MLGAMAEEDELYSGEGLDIYEQAHYASGEHEEELDDLLSWYGRPEGRVLDLGCSGGLHALELARRGYHVVGVDAENLAIARARERASGLEWARFEVMDLEESNPRTLGDFDLIISLGNVLSHLSKVRLGTLLGELRSMLTPEGWLVFNVISAERPFERVITYWREGKPIMVWERHLEPRSGRISQTGDFLEASRKFHQHVFGYRKQEMLQMAGQAGFGRAESGTSLDFQPGKTKTQASFYVRCAP